MKRVRTEQIQMAVACYLKRRQYGDADGPLKQGLRLSQSAEEMAANLAGTTPQGHTAPHHLGLLRAGPYCGLPQALGASCCTDVVCDVFLPEVGLDLWPPLASPLPSPCGPTHRRQA